MEAPSTPNTVYTPSKPPRKALFLGSPFRNPAPEPSRNSLSLDERYYRNILIQEPANRREIVDAMLADSQAETFQTEVWSSLLRCTLHHLMQKHYLQAIECLERSLALKQQVYGSGTLQVSQAIEKIVNLCNKYAMQYMQQSKLDQAFELLKKAEALTSPNNSISFQKRMVLRAVTFNNLGCFYRRSAREGPTCRLLILFTRRRKKKLPAALEYVQRALKIETQYKEADNPGGTHLNLGPQRAGSSAGFSFVSRGVFLPQRCHLHHRSPSPLVRPRRGHLLAAEQAPGSPQPQPYRPAHSNGRGARTRLRGLSRRGRQAG